MLSGDMMSSHRKLHQIPESSSEFQSSYPPETPPTGFRYPKLETMPSVGLIVGIVIGWLILFVAVGIFVILCLRRKWRRTNEEATLSEPIYLISVS